MRDGTHGCGEIGSDCEIQRGRNKGHPKGTRTISDPARFPNARGRPPRTKPQAWSSLNRSESGECTHGFDRFGNGARTMVPVLLIAEIAIMMPFLLHDPIAGMMRLSFDAYDGEILRRAK